MRTSHLRDTIAVASNENARARKIDSVQQNLSLEWIYRAHRTIVDYVSLLSKVRPVLLVSSTL